MGAPVIVGILILFVYFLGEVSISSAVHGLRFFDVSVVFFGGLGEVP